MKQIQTLLIMAILALIIGGLVAFRVFEYRECVKVGHGSFYCVLHR